MKRNLKKWIACVLAALMLMSSVPFSAFAADAKLVALNNAIIDFESKMDGTVYENMQAAFDAYAAAKEAAYAYEFGGKTDIDMEGIADALSAAVINMTKWTPYTGDKTPSFVNDTEGKSYSGYAQNILFTVENSDNVAAHADGDTPNLKDGSGEHRVETWVYYPVSVLLYDGVNTPTMPIVSLSEITYVFGGKKDRNLYSLYPAVLGNSNPDSLFDMKDEYWIGANGEDDRTVNWPWTMNQNNGLVCTGPLNADQKDIFLSLTTKSAYLVTYDALKAAIANSLIFVGNESDFGSKNYIEKYLTWRRFSGGDGPNDIVEMTTSSTPTYVINYKPLRDAVSNTVSAIAASPESYLKNKSAVSAVLAAVDDATAFDPNGSFGNAGTVRNNVISCANTIKQKTDAIGSLASAAMNDYDTLASYLSNYNAVYRSNNISGKYTDESFAAFKGAYDAAKAEAASVYSNGFTSVKTANALFAAYKALNVKTSGGGNSGATDYSYDETTGTVEITGPGAMEDYESGDESPFGNNSGITEVVISDDVTYIGANTFKGANNLTTITVPATATYGEGAFDDCTKLSTVIIVGGAVENASAVNAPWQQPSVKLVKLGENENDASVSAIGNNVFTNMKNTAFYVYNPDCAFSDTTNATFGANPTIYGYSPSTAMAYANKFNYTFVSLGHEHVWQTSEVVEATCTKSGYTVFTCKYCDKTKKGDYVSALGHAYDTGVIVPATCTERGYTLYTCTREGCGNTKKDAYTAALGHDYSKAAVAKYASNVEKSDATTYMHAIGCSRCDAEQTEYCSFRVNGYKTIGEETAVEFICTTCGGTYLYKTEKKDDEFNVFFLDTDNKPIAIKSVKSGESVPANEIPALKESTAGHRYAWMVNGVEVSSPETYVISDVTVFSMADIVETFKVTYLDALGNFISEETVAYNEKPANVPALNEGAEPNGDNGHYIYKWSGEAAPTATAITADTTFRMTTQLEAHTFSDTMLEEPTCLETGLRSRYCETCGYYIANETVSALGHDIVIDKAVAATCTTAGKTEGSHCTRCDDATVNQKTVPVTGHKWNSGIVTKEATIDATGVKTYTCTVCKATKTEVLPKLTVKEITPSAKEADAAPVNKSIQAPKKITTVSNSKKKQMTISFDAVPGAQNYRVQYRKAGAKKWIYAWTNGKTQYVLNKLKANGLYEFGFAAYKKNAKGAWERGAYSKITRRYYFKHAIKKATPAKGKIKVTWKKKKGASFYQIQYSTKKNMSGAKMINVNNPSQTSYTIKKLKKGKTYYVRIRAIKKYNKKKYVGEYSKRKKVKVKK